MCTLIGVLPGAAGHAAGFGLAGALPAVLAADAGAAGGSAGGSDIFQLVIPFAIFGAFAYFAIYRPQKKKEKKARELIDSIQVGNKITTHSGIVGKVINIKDDMVTIESGVQRTQVEIKKWAIRDVDKPVEP